MARRGGRRIDASADGPRDAALHEVLLHRDGTYFAWRPDHRHGDAGLQRHRGRRRHADRHAAGQVLARRGGRGSLQDADSAPRRNRYRHHGIRGDRPQPGFDRRIPVFPVRRDRHFPPAVVGACHNRNPLDGTLFLQAGQRRGNRRLRRSPVPALRRTPARGAEDTLADNRRPGRPDGGFPIRIYPAQAAVLSGFQHADLLRSLQAAAGNRHPSRVRRSCKG